MFAGIRRAVDLISLTLGVSAVSWVLGYSAGKLVSGAPDAALWIQAATGLCLLVFAGVQVWITLRRPTPS